MEKLTLIFNWIIVSSAVASFLVGIILFVKLIIKDKQSASWHYYIWFILVLRLLIPYAPNSSISIFNTVTPVVEKIATDEINLRAKTPTNIQPMNKIVSKFNNTVINDDYESKHNQVIDSDNSFNLKNNLMVIWIAGSLVFGVYIIFINLRLLSRVKTNIKIDSGSINATINQCKAKLNINREIPVVLTSDVSIPSLLGFAKPVLLLPKGMLGKISNDQLKHIILHELSHYKRKDNVVNWIIVFLKILHWFNPIIWYGFYKMQEDCEIACDAMAMGCMEDKEQSSYGYTIIHLLRIAPRKKCITGTMGILSSKSGIKRRIIMISLFNKKTNKFSVKGLGILLVLSCIMLTNAKDNAAYTNKIVQSDIKTDASLKTNESGKVTNFLSTDSVSIEDIKSRKFDGKVMIVSNPKKIVLGYSLQNSKLNKTTSQIAKEEKAIGAINAGGFKIDKTPSGLLIKDGNVVYSEPRDKGQKLDAVGFNDKGILIVGKYTLAQLKDIGAKEAVGFGPALIINGKPTETVNSNWGIRPRTAIGQKPDGKVVFLVINGKNAEATGATIKEVVDVLIEYGVVNASLLDGGDSSTMYYKGEVINTPSSPSGERVVPSAFLVLP
ncbi:M56 family metallopeptidase [Clostridium sp. JNZ J1-5]